jgi:hypothetical protein
MFKKVKIPSFDESLTALRGYKFDVTSPSAVANHPDPAHPGIALPKGAMQVSKYGCSAILAPGKASAATIVTKPGFDINGEIGHILDKGYQKFIKTPSAERPATADHLRSLHKFSEELRQTIGAVSLYNESMGTVSDEYMYDRVKGRTLPENQRPVRAWEQGDGPAKVS